MFKVLSHFCGLSAGLACLLVLTACSVATPRTDDPWEGFNRKAYHFNDAVDRAAIRPVAKGYRAITPEGLRDHVSLFYNNVHSPITIGNELLQGHPIYAAQTTGRLLINTTLGFFGFFDLAKELGLPKHETDFSITLARWGVGEGPFLMAPLLGPTTARDVWKFPVDGYFFNPLTIFARKHHYDYGQQYLPELVYLVTLRAKALNIEDYLASAYDPYVFLRDAYRQRQIYKIYDGNPPDDVIDVLQGTGDNDDDFDPEALLDEQKAWESSHDQNAAE